MKLTDLYEAKELSGYKLVLEAKTKILQDCKPFLSMIDTVPMLRGAASGTAFSRKTIRENRKPRNSGHNSFFQWFFNACIEKTFGVKNVRTSSLFVSGSESTAFFYGNPYFIFPIGNFDFIWSPKVNDSYEDLDLVFHQIFKADVFSSRAEYYKFTDEILTPYFKKMNDAQNYDISNVLKNGPHPEIVRMKDWLEKEFASYKYVKNSNLKKALDTGKEIFIPAPGEYYAIDSAALAQAVGNSDVDDLHYTFTKFMEIVNQP